MSFLISATNQSAHIIQDITDEHNTHTSNHITAVHAQCKVQSNNTQNLVFTNLHHLAQLGQVASDEVEEGELVEVLGPLVAHLHHLVVTLQQGCLTQTLPAAALI